MLGMSPRNATNAADAALPVATDDLLDLVLGMADAGQVRSGLERRLVDDPLDGVMRALARRAARTVGDRELKDGASGSSRRIACQRLSSACAVRGWNCW